MVEIPIDTRLKVEQLIEDPKVESELRSYLGISQIADDCARNLWYGFRLCKKEEFSPKTIRLLSRGHREEPIIIADLEKIGIKVSGTQDECVTGHGHIKGHCDGIGDNIPDAPKTSHLLEFKTANDKNFKKFKKEGVKKANQVYYGQLVCYMHLLKLKRALFIVVNKNNDERYYERVECNNELAKELIERGVDIISTNVPPQKINGPDWYRCKWCKHYDICHFGDEIEKTCRTCEKVQIEEDGGWSCEKSKSMLSFDEQKKACDYYELLGTLG